MKKIIITAAIGLTVQFALAQTKVKNSTIDSLLSVKDQDAVERQLYQQSNSGDQQDFELFSAYMRAKSNPSLYALSKENDQQKLNKTLSSLERSKNEKDLVLLASYLESVNQGEKASTIRAKILKNFRQGFTAFEAEMNKIFNETDGTKNEARHAAFVKRFGQVPALKGHAYFDYVKYYVALSYMNTDTKKMIPWISKISDPDRRAKSFSYGAIELLNKGNTKDAETLISKAFEELEKQNRRSSSHYKYCAAAAAKILLGNKKYEEGLKYARIAYQPKNEDSQSLEQTYLNLLVGTQNYGEAYPIMEEAIRSGVASDLVKERFTEAYRTVKGNAEEASNRYIELRSVFTEGIKKSVAKEMVKSPAFNFAFKTPDGKTVTLESLEGKVVVLDFWATWCAPCKASFPMMQRIANTYKDDKEVVFLFVHTLESSANPTADAVNYLKANNYDFNLLMDFRDQQTKKNPGVIGFDIKGIPTKIILDKSGNVRFRTMGNKEGEDFSTTELKAMIELSKKG